LSSLFEAFGKVSNVFFRKENVCAEVGQGVVNSEI
jgi:hypothetical protein